MDEAEVNRRIEGLPTEQAQSVICALVGHSKIETICFGYHYCARCGAQVGDTLASVYSGAEEAIVVGHNCEVCRENYAKLDWRSKMLAPDPFAETAAA